MADNFVIEWSWDFGDGNIFDIFNLFYIYDSLGEYNVCLIVIDFCGIVIFCDIFNIVVMDVKEFFV